MNYIKEVNAFFRLLDSEPLTPNSILLWYTLIGFANSFYWKEEFQISLPQLEHKTKLNKSTICRARDHLVSRGLITYKRGHGKSSAVYMLHSLEQFDLKGAFQNLPLHNATIRGSLELQSATISNDVELHSATISSDLELQSATHYKTIYINNKENIKEKMEVGAEAPPYPPPTPEKKEKVAPKRKKSSSPPWDENGWILSLESPWMELMQTWLVYKQSRKERYKSEMSATKCLEQLKRLSSGDPKVAQEVVDQSIANNWAGLFELKRQPYYARGQPMPAQGQHIGQIKQPKSEEARQKILDKFKPQPIKHKP